MVQTTDAPLTFLITGATGFLGRRLVIELLARNTTCKLLAMSRPNDPQQADAERYIRARTGSSVDRVEWIAGDICRPMLGFSDDQVTQLAKGPTLHIVHLAALYDLEVAEKLSKALNLDGALRAYELAVALVRHPDRKGRPIRFCHTSTLAVAGNYQGTFGETGEELRLSEGKHTDWYSRHKYEAEVSLRRMAQTGDVPLMVVRPGIAVGDSTTGEIEKLDGPYGLLEYLRWPLVRHFVPWSAEDPFWIVPGDFIVRAIATLAGNPEAYGHTFNLLYPPDANPTWAQFLRHTLSVLRNEAYSGGPMGAVRGAISYGWYIPVPTRLLIGSGRLPLLGRLIQKALSAMGCEPHSLFYTVANPTYHVGNYLQFGVRPPPPWQDMWRTCIQYYRDHRRAMRQGAVIAHQKGAIAQG